MARFFVNRPIVAIVLSIILVLLGVVAMQGLPIAQYPEIVPPMVQVTTTFIGASATDVEASVATPLEQKINGVEKGIYLKSTNANDGTLTLKVSFEVGSDLDMDNVSRRTACRRPCPRCRSLSRTTASPGRRPWRFPCLSSPSSRPRAPTTAAFCRITRPSTSTMPSRASPEWDRSIYSAAATTPCACGCGRTSSGALG